ncbi:hypothetical protein SIM54_22890 [Bacillus cereus group sp. BfR-BA-02147]|uniref:hypothetical protein n=1 Tax=Bacillus cereus group sp. BfR-BA-02147 TaxID=3094887 RepID=UPI0029C43C74|nr:hypothetical protein [Bacillus cereus group sp. BfR-BA-02147]MDX5828928.1 hypothetical protein [Bacillus cereus group sp. BfR-BA-02147]
MFFKLFKSKGFTSKEIMQEEISDDQPILYENLTFNRTLEENSMEFEVTILDKFNPYHNALKIYNFKIADDIQIFHKVIDINTNEIEYRSFKSIPYIGVEKVTLEYNIHTFPEYYKLDFKFIFCQKDCDTNIKPNIFYEGYTCSSFNPDEVKELLYEIQRGIQQTINKKKGN